MHDFFLVFANPQQKLHTIEVAVKGCCEKRRIPIVVHGLHVSTCEARNLAVTTFQYLNIYHRDSIRRSDPTTKGNA
jgi:hypothetical protein